MDTNSAVIEKHNQKNLNIKEYKEELNMRIIKMLLLTGFSFVILLSTGFVKIDRITNVNAQIQAINPQTTVATPGDCYPLDLIIAIDQSSQMNEKDPEGLRIEAVKFLLRSLAASHETYCNVDDRVSVISFNGSVNVDFGFLPLNNDVANLIVATDDLTNQRDILGAIEEMKYQFKDLGEEDGRRAIGIIISSKMGSPCLPDFPCTSSVDNSKQLSSYINFLEDLPFDEEAGPFFYMIGIPDILPGDFSRNIPVWNEILGERGEFYEIDSFLDFPVKMLNIVQEHSNRNIQNIGCRKYNIPPFTETLALFIFDDDSQGSIPVEISGADYETGNQIDVDTSNIGPQSSISARNHMWEFSNVEDEIFGSMTIGGNRCDSTVIFLQQKNGTPIFKFKEEPMPLLENLEEFALDDNYKLSVLFPLDNENVWKAICNTYKGKYEIDSVLTNERTGELVDWDDGGFYCQWDEQRFISGNRLWLSEEGSFSIDLVGTISGEQVPFFEYSGGYNVKPKTKITYQFVEPQKELPEHGDLLTKDFWMKKMPLEISVNLVKVVGDSYENIQPSEIARNSESSGLSSISGLLVSENNDVVKFTLNQEIDKKSMFSGVIPATELGTGEYSILLDVPDEGFDTINYTFTGAQTSFIRQDDFFDKPILYIIALSLISLLILTLLFSYIKSYSRPLSGNLIVSRQGNVARPFAKIPLKNKHIRKKTIFEDELIKIHPLLNGIKKMKFTAYYSDKELSGILVEMKNNEQGNKKPVLLINIDDSSGVISEDDNDQSISVDNVKKTLITKSGIQLYFKKE